jgi:tRNA dimethylallyltransferase
MTLSEAAQEGKRDTRRYTKRQATWFRNQMSGWEWMVPEAAESAILAQISA